MRGLKDIDYVLAKLAFMRNERIWPNGLRYLWTDAFGVVLLVSLYEELKEERFLDEAEWLVADVMRVLGRKRGIRIGEEADRDGQYFHYLSMWLYALYVLGRLKPEYRERGIALARDIHRPFVVPGRGVIWKMKEDLSGPYPGYGFGALDAFDGYVSYRLLDEQGLAEEIAEMKEIIDETAGNLVITQDLGLGMMLWMSQFFPEEKWAELQRRRSLAMLDRMWVDEGYFCREPYLPEMRFAFTNYGVSVGLQAVDAMPDRVDALNAYFDTYRSGDEYDRNAITHVMACNSHFPGLTAAVTSERHSLAVSQTSTRAPPQARSAPGLVKMIKLIVQVLEEVLHLAHGEFHFCRVTAGNQLLFQRIQRRTDRSLRVKTSV